PRSPAPDARQTAAHPAPPPATPLGRARAPEAVACPATPVPLVRSRANLQTVYRATSMPPALIRKESSATCFGNKNLAVLQRFTTSEERASARVSGALRAPKGRGHGRNSLGLNPCKLRNPAPLHGPARDEAGEVAGRAGARLRSPLLQALGDGARLQAVADRRIQRRDPRRRRAGRRHHAAPERQDEIRNAALDHGRPIGE